MVIMTTKPMMSCSQRTETALDAVVSGSAVTVDIAPPCILDKLRLQTACQRRNIVCQQYSGAAILLRQGFAQCGRRPCAPGRSKPVKQEIDHRRCVDREELRHGQAAKNRVPERRPKFRT